MDFWKSFGASLLALVVGTGIIFFIMIASIGGLVALFDTEEPTIAKESILYIDFAEDIIEAVMAEQNTDVSAVLIKLQSPLFVSHTLF